MALTEEQEVGLLADLEHIKRSYGLDGVMAYGQGKLVAYPINYRPPEGEPKEEPTVVDTYVQISEPSVASYSTGSGIVDPPGELSDPPKKAKK